MKYYPAYICLNGDIIEASADSCDDLYCEYCGAQVISKCQKCGKKIRGHEHGACGYLERPAYCRGCGSPYPWTDAALATAAELIQGEENLPFGERQLLLEVVPDMVTETPRTRLAAVRIKKVFKSLSRFTAEAFRSFLIDFGCDLLKELLGLS